LTIKNKYNKPPTLNDLEKWSTNRRRFIKSVGVVAIYSQILRLNSCKNIPKKVYQSNEYLNALQAEIIQKVQTVLFPNDGNGPSVDDVNAYSHFIWVISDKRKRQAEIDYLINGIGWTEETAIEQFNKSFSQLNDIEVEQLVEFIANEKWGKDWLSVVLTLIFEALALDSIYNINTNQVGWKWLSHQNGTPRPNIDITYDNIFKTIGAE
jgi:gluconate 2-dehydrogenase gamma chain